VLEIGRRMGVPAPTIEGVYGLTRLHLQQRVGERSFLFGGNEILTADVAAAYAERQARVVGADDLVTGPRARVRCPCNGCNS
jgi:hypothetical protein